MKQPKYRWRTRLRGIAPYWLADRIPKGSKHCGQCEWYVETREPYQVRCYHCEVGRTQTRLPEYRLGNHFSALC